jgi:hypothetical protein
MAEPTRIVKGGFRATLALIISVLALLLSIMSFTSSGTREGLQSRIQELQATLEEMRLESTRQLDILRDETAEALEEMSQAIQTGEGSQKSE